LVITFIGKHINDSNTQRFEMNINTFIANESFSNYKMFNTKYQGIRMQLIIFVTLPKPKNKTEVLSTKK